MTLRQHPLGTGFTPASTVDDVLRGMDLTGQHVIITAGHTGLGAVVTRALTAAGASVTVGSRYPERAATEVEGVPGVGVSQLDLLDPASIEAFATRWIAGGRPLHILINNAGLPAPAELVLDARGYEAQFATSYLGHFQLTRGLRSALPTANGARVVNVSSGAHRFSDIRWDDVNFRTGYDPSPRPPPYCSPPYCSPSNWTGGGQLTASTGMRPIPGVVVGTSLNGAVGDDALRAMGLIDESGHPVIDPSVGKKTPEQGASTIVFAATSPLLRDIGGVSGGWTGRGPQLSDTPSVATPWACSAA